MASCETLSKIETNLRQTGASAWPQETGTKKMFGFYQKDGKYSNTPEGSSDLRLWDLIVEDTFSAWRLCWQEDLGLLLLCVVAPVSLDVLNSWKLWFHESGISVWFVTNSLELIAGTFGRHEWWGVSPLPRARTDFTAVWSYLRVNLDLQNFMIAGVFRESQVFDVKH